MKGDQATIGTDELYEMANLYPRTTGLPMTVWVSPRGHARHDVRINVNTIHGDQMNVDNVAVVAVRPSPRTVACHLSTEDERAIATWITLNTDALVAYRDGAIDTIQLARALVPLAS